MPAKNTVIPNEKLSSRQRIARKIATFGDNPWTLRDINRLLRPRMKIDNIRFHVENLVNNLYVEKLARRGREPQLYVYRDLIKNMDSDPNFQGLARQTLSELQKLAQRLRSGEVVSDADLLQFRRDIGKEVDELKEEYTNLAKLHDCLDLWSPDTLVERLGFTEDQ